MTEQNQDTNAAHAPEAVPVEPKESKAPKVVQIVTMDNGEVVNFGVRANLLSSFDPDEKTITFRISSGKTITWTPPELEGLSEFQIKVYMYGLVEKIKSTLGAIKDLYRLEAAIAEQIASLNEKEFSVRLLNQASELGLTDLQKAYAIAMSKQHSDKIHWADVTDTAVITEVLNVWENKTPVERGKIRRHPYVAAELALLQINQGGIEVL